VVWRGSVFGHNLTSDIELAGHELLARPLADLAVRVVDAVSFEGVRIDRDQNARFQVWQWPGHLGFDVVGVGQAVVLTDAGAVLVDRSLADSSECRHLLATLVLPRLLVARGHLALHGAGVVVRGVCVAILGDTTIGKSSLAAEAMSRGHGVLTDDCLLIDVVGRRAWPGERVMRPRHFEASGAMNRRDVPIAFRDGAVPLGAFVVVHRRGPSSEFRGVEGRRRSALVHPHAFVSSDGSIAPSLRGVLAVTLSVPVYEGETAEGDVAGSLDAILAVS
jgi:hypothetical protein